MMTRALIVMLVVLNLGVAAWWIWHPRADDAVAEAAPENTGIARLQLLSERRDPTAHPAAAPAAAPAGAAAASTNASVPKPEASAKQCYRFGPYANPMALAAAKQALQPLVVALQGRDIPRGGGARGWRVIIPPAVDRAAADANAGKLKAAGFSDLFVIGEGGDANAIALGRFSGEARAQEHATKLRAAGFAAVAEPLGGAAVEHWIELVAGRNFDLPAARRASGAAQSTDIPCPAR